MTGTYVHRTETARKNEQLVLQSLARVGQVRVAEAMGVSESTVSRYKNGELAQLAGFIAALGLKVVPTEYRCMDPEKNKALLTLAKAYLRDIEHPNQLSDDDPE